MSDLEELRKLVVEQGKIIDYLNKELRYTKDVVNTLTKANPTVPSIATVRERYLDLDRSKDL